MMNNTGRWLSLGMALLVSVSLPGCQPTQQSLVGNRNITLEPGEAVHFEVVLNEAAIEFQRAYPEGSSMLVRLLEYSEDLFFIPDDETVATSPGRHVYAENLQGCAAMGPCVLGYTLENRGTTSFSFDVEVRLTTEAGAGASLFEATPEFPSDAAIEVVLDGE